MYSGSEGGERNWKVSWCTMSWCHTYVMSYKWQTLSNFRLSGIGWSCHKIWACQLNQGIRFFLTETLLNTSTMNLIITFKTSTEKVFFISVIYYGKSDNQKPTRFILWYMKIKGMYYSNLFILILLTAILYSTSFPPFVPFFKRF